MTDEIKARSKRNKPFVKVRVNAKQDGSHGASQVW
jgi:hypothetical protein